jgi:hypothetical protein
MKLEHVIYTDYLNNYPYSESHYIKFGNELILIGCNGTDWKENRYGKLADLIVEAVNKFHVSFPDKKEVEWKNDQPRRISTFS